MTTGFLSETETAVQGRKLLRGPPNSLPERRPTDGVCAAKGKWWLRKVAWVNQKACKGRGTGMSLVFK